MKYKRVSETEKKSHKRKANLFAQLDMLRTEIIRKTWLSDITSEWRTPRCLLCFSIQWISCTLMRPTASYQSVSAGSATEGGHWLLPPSESGARMLESILQRPFIAHNVWESPTKKQQSSKYNHVSIEYPLKISLGKFKLLLNCRQCRSYNWCIQNDDWIKLRRQRCLNN